jgi:DNA-binding NarL/FixJ family response regulator
MTEATAWAELAAQERAAHRRAWGRTSPVQSEKMPPPKNPKGRIGPYNPERLEQIRKWVHQRKTNAWIARELKISESSVRYWRVQYNLK